MNNRSKITFVTIAVVALAIGAAVGVRSGRSQTMPSATPVAVVEARDGSSEMAIMAEGNVIPSKAEPVVLMPGLQGAITDVYVDVGDRVTKGQVLAKLDPTLQQQDYERAINDRQSSAARFSLIRRPHLPQEIERMRLTLDTDRKAISQAGDRLAVLHQGSRPQEVTAAEQVLASAQTKSTFASSEESRNQQLFDRDLISRSELEQSQADAQVASSAVNQAQAQLSLLKAGSRPEDINIGQSDLERAKIQYASDEQAYSLMVQGSRSEDISMAAADLRSMQIDVDEKQRLLSQCLVRAPISGIVTGRYVNPGEIAASVPLRINPSSLFRNSSKSLFMIADDTKMDFLANVDQLYYSSLHIGQPASVGIESLPGRKFFGKVVRITPIINPDSGKKGSSVAINPSAPFTFNVWVRMDNPSGILLPGQLGQITMQDKQAGIMVPQSAVTPLTVGSGVAYVVDGGVAHARSIQYADNLDGNLRVLSGIHAHDLVVVSKSATKVADGDAVTPLRIGSDTLTAKGF